MERKFTDDEIVKALNCCGSENCRGCPYWDYKCHGGNQMIRDALDLINRQKAEIADERARKELCAEVIKRLDKESETARAEAIKEFAERLKANMSNIARMEYGGYTYFCVGDGLIDNLVKEMTEGKT